MGTAITDNCDYLMFTGSSATGSRLAEHAGRRLIGFSAELGGKNPMIVARGANLDKVAKAATRACFSNAGQLCISIERIYVEKDIAEEFTRKFGDAVRNMKLGTAYDFSVDMGSLISEAQLKTVSGHVDDATAKGAKVIAGGKARPDIGPLFYEPTVLTNVAPEMECAANETFGPVVSIYPVADVDEAVEKANDTDYGLNASVWAGSTAEGQRIAARLRSGTVNVDEGTRSPGAASARRWAGWASRGRPPARSGGLAQVHRITDDRDRPRVQSRSALRHPGHSLAEVTVTHRAHRDEASRPQVTARPSAT